MTFIPCGCSSSPPDFNPSGYGDNSRSPSSIAAPSNGVVPAGAIYTATLGNAVGDNGNVGIAINNSGDLTAVRGGIVAGTFGRPLGPVATPVAPLRTRFTASTPSPRAMRTAPASNAAVHIENSGSAFGGTGAGIYAFSNSATTIVTTAFSSRALASPAVANRPSAHTDEATNARVAAQPESNTIWRSMTSSLG
jgi:hypothetical protein